MRSLGIFLFLSIFGGTLVSGQVQRILHQEFAVSDSTTEIKAALYGDYVVKPWPGNNVLLESQIKLYNATEGILELYLVAGRYELLSEYQGPVLLLTARDQEHLPIKTNRGESFEDLQQRLFIPEDFVEVARGHWRRPAKQQPNAGASPEKGEEEAPQPVEEGTEGDD